MKRAKSAAVLYHQQGPRAVYVSASKPLPFTLTNNQQAPRSTTTTDAALWYFGKSQTLTKQTLLEFTVVLARFQVMVGKHFFEKIRYELVCPPWI